MKCRTEQLAATKERIEKQKFPTITQTHYPLETKGELLRKPTIPDIPAVKQAEITCTDRELGPRVPTILVIVGKKLQKTRGQQTTKFQGASNTRKKCNLFKISQTFTPNFSIKSYVSKTRKPIKTSSKAC